MSRCYACCQENCGYGACGCSCHGAAKASTEPTREQIIARLVEAARGVRYKTKALRDVLAEYDRRFK